MKSITRSSLLAQAWDFNTGVHKSGFNGRSLAEDLPLLLDLLSEALITPTFPKD